MDLGAVLRDQYRIERVLGRGGMGGVYLATHLSTANPVAVKELLFKPVDQEERDASTRIFQSEAKMLYSLRHARLPRMYDFFEYQDHWYLVMDFVEGESLSEVLTKEGPMEESRVRQIAMELVDVFDYLHSRPRPVIFRDLKPANVILEPSGHVKLVDFGIAKLHQGGSGNTDPFVKTAGTMGFAAPEQYGGESDARTDIYSLGATCYTLLTDVVPPPGPVQWVGVEVLVALSSLRSDVTPEFAHLLTAMMSLRPDERPASMEAVGEALMKLPALTTPTVRLPASWNRSVPLDPPVRETPAATPAAAEAPSAVPLDDTLLLVGPPETTQAWGAAAAAMRRPTRVAADIEQALAELARATPLALLLHIDSVNTTEAMGTLMEHCRRADVPVLAVGFDGDTVRTRLPLAALGVHLYYVEPVSAPTVLAGAQSLITALRHPAPVLLAIDDDRFVLDALELIFEMYGVKCHCLNDPLVFLDTVEQVHPDMLILDVHMPRVSGLELCRMVRTHPQWRLLPILMLTAATDADSIRAVYDAGADDYASKPILGEELYARVHNRLVRYLSRDAV